MRRTGWRMFLVLLVVFAFLAAACGDDDDVGGGDDDTNQGATGNEGQTGGTLVFGTSTDPVSLDPAYVSDGESLRVADQIFETLVTTEEGGTDPAPSLAKSWESSDDGLAWTFELQTGVKFHDGTDFNADAVCTNFDRWYNFKGVQQSANVSYYWQTVFSGYAHNEGDLPESLYKSCEAVDDDTVTINLTSPSASFVAGLAVPAFSIASPAALEKYDADKVGGTNDEPNIETPFGTAHPIGTGPFKFVKWVRSERLEMARNDDYWGDKAKLDRLIFQPIADGSARRQALESGDIQGFDFVNPADLQDLDAAGFQILERPAFNVGYVGMNQAKPPLDNPKIRQAIAHALNREALVKAKYPPGAEVAKEFMPPELFGYADDVTEYDYDPDLAKQLIQDSGVTNPTIEFWYPTNVSRPYMPEPEANFQAFKSDLEKVGFKIVPKSGDWEVDYIDTLDGGNAQMYLFGWTGDFGDPDNFVGTFFRTKQPSWGFDNAEIRNKLEEARKEGDEDKRVELYQEANRLIMDFLPGVPYVHTKPALAFASNVKGYVPSPVSIEPFSIVSVESD